MLWSLSVLELNYANVNISTLQFRTIMTRFIQKAILSQSPKDNAQIIIKGRQICTSSRGLCKNEMKNIGSVKDSQMHFIYAD